MVDGGTRSVPGWRNVLVSLVIGWGMEESVFTGVDQKVSFCFPKLLSGQRHREEEAGGCNVPWESYFNEMRRLLCPGIHSPEQTLRSCFPPFVSQLLLELISSPFWHASHLSGYDVTVFY